MYLQKYYEFLRKRDYKTNEAPIFNIYIKEEILNPGVYSPEIMQCVICKKNKKVNGFTKCDHICLCYKCALTIHKCPICN